jgi:ribosomal protein S18 acetylase RimI-like enzyme
MPMTKEKRDERNSLIKRALFIVVLLSLMVLIVYYIHRENKQASNMDINSLEKVSGDKQTEITVRPATPADYAYYLESYPDLEIDHPPADEVMWNKSDLPDVTIITQGTQSVGYIWTRKYDELYYLIYLVIGREYRRKGIGTKALKHVKNQAKQLGYNKWGLDCDMNHPIPYKMYIKAGMSKVGELYHVKAPYDSSLSRKTNMNVMVVHDSDQWPLLEDKYGLRRGRIRTFSVGGSLPILLVDSSGQTHGFVIFSPISFVLSSLVVDNSDNLLFFLGLLQDLKASTTNPEWIHFFTDTGKKYSEIVLSSLPGAVVCEQFDMLQGSTS